MFVFFLLCGEQVCDQIYRNPTGANKWSSAICPVWFEMQIILFITRKDHFHTRVAQTKDEEGLRSVSPRLLSPLHQLIWKSKGCGKKHWWCWINLYCYLLVFVRQTRRWDYWTQRGVGGLGGGSGNTIRNESSREGGSSFWIETRPPGASVWNKSVGGCFPSYKCQHTVQLGSGETEQEH